MNRLRSDPRRSPRAMKSPPLLRGLSPRVFIALLAALPLSPLRAQPSTPKPEPTETPAAKPPEADLTAAEPPAAEVADQESFAPASYSIDRYQKMRGKSPFEFELAKPPAQETADPFADFVLAGFAGSGSRVTVYLMNSKTQERLTVLSSGSEKENKSGFHVVKVNRGRTLSTTTALIEKDGTQKELAFDPKALSSMSGGAGGGAMAGAAPPGGKPGQPGARPAVPGQPGARPAQAYQAPQAFIPGQPSRAAASAAPVANAVNLPNQPGASPNNPQQQVNALVNANPGQVAPAVNPAALPAATLQPPANGGPPSRRRVVLPNPSP